MTDPVPSKDEVERLQRRIDEQDQQMHQMGVCQTCVDLREDNRRWLNAHKIWMDENKRLKKQVEELSVHAEKGVKSALGGEPDAYYAALNRLAVAMGNPALHWKDPETIESALVDEAARRLSKPAHEREMPHCVSCSCPPYPAPEPADGKRIDLPIAIWAQALDIIGQCAEIDAMDDHATAWIREANKFFDSHAVSLTESAQPPGDRQ